MDYFVREHDRTSSLVVVAYTTRKYRQIQYRVRVSIRFRVLSEVQDGGESEPGPGDKEAKLLNSRVKSA